MSQSSQRDTSELAHYTEPDISNVTGINDTERSLLAVSDSPVMASKCCQCFLMCSTLLLDFLAFGIVIVPVLLFRLPGIEIPVYHRGFFCNDESISYPYKDSTVPALVNYAIGIGLTISLVIITELFIYIHRQRLDIDYLGPKDDNHCCGGFMIPALLFQIGRCVAIFFFGLLATMASTDIMKNMVGRLRPHFFSVCQPVLMETNCTDGYMNFYITEDVCTGDQEKIIESRRSFPSGHSSTIAYCMFFLVLYLQSRWHSRSLMYIRPLIQFVAIMIATCICLSRISDYKHHWSDVIGGAILGVIAATCMMFAVGSLFRRSNQASVDSGFRNDLFMEMNGRNGGSRSGEGIF